MEPYGESLRVDDERLAATHFQNNRVPRESACFTCHTDYTLFGDVNAKLRGLKHVWVYYVTGPPEELALYSPYRNRECLHCHDGARSFEENEMHADVMADLRGEATSCLECHEPVHDVAGVADAPRWQPAEEGGDG
jgi:cytochrome c-type protein NapC